MVASQSVGVCTKKKITKLTAIMVMAKILALRGIAPFFCQATTLGPNFGWLSSQDLTWARSVREAPRGEDQPDRAGENRQEVSGDADAHEHDAGREVERAEHPVRFLRGRVCGHSSE